MGSRDHGDSDRADTASEGGERDAFSSVYVHASIIHCAGKKIWHGLHTVLVIELQVDRNMGWGGGKERGSDSNNTKCSSPGSGIVHSWPRLKKSFDKVQ